MKNTESIVLAIDPGFDRLGVAILKKEKKGALTLLYSDCIITDRKNTHEQRLEVVGRTIVELIETWKPTEVAIEELFFSKNVKSALLVSQALGVMMYEISKSNTEIFFYKPVEVKVAVTGYGQSDKTHVMNMVPKLIKMKEKKRHDDEFDAIAVGLTHLASFRRNQSKLPRNH